MKQLFFILISFLLLTACSKDDGYTEPEYAQKTIFVFMPYSGPSNDLHYAFLKNLQDMETSIKESGGLGANRLVVFKASGRNGAIVDSLIQITYSKGKCVRKTLKTDYNYDYTTPSGMAGLLQDVKDMAPAHTYAMIVGCHGEGWLPKNHNSTNTKTRFFGGTNIKYQIDITDFAQGIAQADMHMQFILFDDCYLSCIENAYDLRNVTDHLIASTSEIMAYGMPYHLILSDLMKAEPDYQAVSEKFFDFYSNNIDPYGTIGVTDCRYVEDMANLMATINKTYEFDSNKLSDVQDLDAGHCQPTVYFDFGDYVKNLCGSDQTLYSEYTALLDKLVPHKAATDRIYSMADGRSIRVNSFSGITISDPTTNSTYTPYKTQTNWWKATH